MTYPTNQTMSNRAAPRRRHKFLVLIGAALMAGAPVASAYAQDAGVAPMPPVASGPTANGPDGKSPGKDQARMAEHDGGRGDWRGRDGWGGRHMGGPAGPRRMMMMHRMMMQMMSPARIAGALSTLETGMGITPDQMAVWRRFSGALVTFAAASQPPHMGPGMRHGMGRDKMGQTDDRSADAGNQPDPADSQDQADDQSLDGQTMDDSADAPAQAGNSMDQKAQAQPGAGAFRFLDRIADGAIARGEAAKALKTAVAELQTTLTPQQIATGRALARSMMQEARQQFRQERRDRMQRGEMRHGGRHGHHEHHGHFADRGGRGGHDGHRGFGSGGRHGDHRGGSEGRDGGWGGRDGQGPAQDSGQDMNQGSDQDNGPNPDNGANPDNG